LIIGTTAPHLNIRDIKKFTLPKYPVALQQQIIARLDGTFEVLHEQEATLDAQLLQSTRLRQAVLKRAFEGRLV
jgi:type I restriction enzyme S subunit